MEGIMRPLEQRVYSWLLVNTSKTSNATYYPFFLPASPVNLDFSSDKEMTKSFFDIAFQDLSLGFLSLLVLQKSFRRLQSQCEPGNLLTGKWNLKFYDILLKNIFKTLVGVALMLITLPLVLPVVYTFSTMSFLVKCAYSYQFRHSALKAEGMDGVWGLETKESRPFIVICLLLSGFPNVDDIRHHIFTQIINIRDDSGDYKFKKFRQTFSQVHGYYMWRDVDTFNITNHVRVIDLQTFYNQETNNVISADININHHKNEEESPKVKADRLLLKFLSEEGTTALSGERPPWEVLLLVRGDGSYNVVIRLHHAIGDGVSLMRLCVERLVDTPLKPPSVGPKIGNAFIRAAMMIWSAMVLPFGLLQVVANFDHNALHGCALSGKKIIVSSRGLPLPILKEIKLAAGATVNDVLMSCLSASLSKHFSRRSENVEQVTAVVPVSFHDLTSPIALTNQFSVATVKLPSGLMHTSKSRLMSTKAIMDGMKRDPTLMAVFAVVKAVSGVLPAPVAELLLSGRGVTVAASNVPGPQQQITVWGDKVLDLHFWVPNRAPVGVGFSFASYMGMVNVGLNIDAALVHSRDEAQQLLDDVETEMYALHQQLAYLNVH